MTVWWRREGLAATCEVAPLTPGTTPHNRLVGLVVKASASGAEDPGFESRLRREFFGGRVIPVI